MPHTTCPQCLSVIASLPNRPVVRELAQYTSQVVEVPFCVIFSESRTAGAAYARALLSYMLHTEAGYQPRTIADMFRKPPSTIQRQIERIRYEQRCTQHVRLDINAIKSKINF